jgi:hypothetical protein
VAGIEEGRIAYDNVRKVIYLLGSIVLIVSEVDKLRRFKLREP